MNQTFTDQEKADAVWPKSGVTVSRLADRVTLGFDGGVPSFDVALLCAFWHPAKMEIEAGFQDDYVIVRLTGCRL